MVSLRNFEYFANSGVPVVGATVTVYAAILAGVHGPALSFTDALGAASVLSTSTDTNGMWEANGLADGQYDVMVTYANGVKWYKGLTRHTIGHLYDDTTPDPNRNLLQNGGQDSWVERGSGAIALPTTDPGVPNTADGWITFLGAGDSGTAQLDTGVAAPNSKSSTKIVYTRSGGQARHCRDLPDGVWQGCKGLQVSASFTVFQLTTTSVLGAYIDDGVGTSVGTVTNVVGSWGTVGVTRGISPSATRVRIGIVTARSDTGARTFYIDNGMADITSVVPVFAPEPNDALLVPLIARSTIVEAAPVSDSNTLAGLFNNLAERVRAIVGAGGNDWKDTVPRTLTQLVTDLSSGLALKVAKSGDTMSGLLNANGGITLSAGSGGINNAATAGTTLQNGPVVVQGGILATFANTLGVLISGSGGLAVTSAAGFAVTQATSLANGLVTIAASGLTALGGSGGVTVTNTGGMVVSSAAGVGVTGAAGLSVITTMNAGVAQEAGVDLLRVTEQAFDSARLGGATPGSGSGQIPINNGALNSNLAAGTAVTAGSATNAAQLGGVAAASYPQRVSGTYNGNGVFGRVIATGFTPQLVQILFDDGGSNHGMGQLVQGASYGVASLRNINTPVVNFNINTLIVSGGFQVDGTGINNWANTSGFTYYWVALG